MTKTLFICRYNFWEKRGSFLYKNVDKDEYLFFQQASAHNYKSLSWNLEVLAYRETCNDGVIVRITGKRIRAGHQQCNACYEQLSGRQPATMHSGNICEPAPEEIDRAFPCIVIFNRIKSLVRLQCKMSNYCVYVGEASQRL